MAVGTGVGVAAACFAKEKTQDARVEAWVSRLSMVRVAAGRSIVICSDCVLISRRPWVSCTFTFRSCSGSGLVPVARKIGEGAGACSSSSIPWYSAELA